METLTINEIFLSLQGESTFAGLPCIFVRLTACNLRCSYCDTTYAFTEGDKMSGTEIQARINALAKPFESARHSPRLPLVELTGGEPLLQPHSLPLMRGLCDAGRVVLLETSGALDIAPVDPRVHRIMDLKCPSSGEAARNRWENIAHLKGADEVKFVIGTEEDYHWACHILTQYQLTSFCPVLFSHVFPLASPQSHPSLKKVPAGQHPISRRQLAERIIADALPVRFQIQTHKLIWPPDARGV